MEIVKIKNLCKSYFTQEKGLSILDNLELTVNEAEIVSVEGASGVGKSTLLNILGAMDDFNSGEVCVCGVNLAGIKESEKEKFRANKISFIFQHHLLLPDFNALENVMMPLLITKMNSRKAKELSIDILKRVGLEERMTSFPSQLSGGESARVGVARALVSRKQLVLADEPTGNLDKNTSKKLMSLILELQRELKFSMIIVTHDMEVASLAHKRNQIILGKIQPILNESL